MAFRLGPLLAGGAVIVVAGMVALFRTERAPEPAGTAQSESPRPDTALPSAPRDHPATPAPQGPRPLEGAGANDEPAITWKVPAGWQPVPNPNGMRLATYDVTDSAGGDRAEVSVSRAGGSTDANIQRWQGQFADAPEGRRAERNVRGLPVTLVEITGTYSSGGMMPGTAPASPHPGWSLVAAIVQTSATSYFFKMIGPAAKVRAARAAFDALVDSLSPR
jgi:hypothetical protein